jgi:hypothetical protein
MGYSDETCIISDLGIASRCRVYGIYLVYVHERWHPTSDLIPGVYDDTFVPDDPELLKARCPERKGVVLSLMRADVVDYVAPMSDVTPSEVEAIRLGVEAGNEWYERHLDKSDPSAVRNIVLARIMAAEGATWAARENGFGFGSYLDPDARAKLWWTVMQGPASDYPAWVRLSKLFLAVNHLLARGWMPKHCTVGVQDSREVAQYRADYHRFLSTL